MILMDKQIDLSSRARCPFYGFEILNRYEDCGGNKCGLETGNTPCDMWFDDIYPDFDFCKFNVKRNKKVLKNCFGYMVKPKELREPVRMSVWRDMIMDESREDFLTLPKIKTLSDDL